MFTAALTTLYVQDIDRSAAFWGGLIGGEERYRFPVSGTPEHIEFRIGEATVALSSAAGLVSHRLPPATRGTPFEIGLRAADVDAAVARLRAAGVPVLVEVFASPAGNRVGYVADPDGNRVQIYGPAKPAGVTPPA